MRPTQDIFGRQSVPVTIFAISFYSYSHLVGSRGNFLPEILPFVAPQLLTHHHVMT